MRKLSGHITKEKAYELMDKHNGLMEQRIYAHGNEHNNYMDYHYCILWGNWFEETDCYGYKSMNNRVIDEFRWMERKPDWILKMYEKNMCL